MFIVLSGCGGAVAIVKSVGRLPLCRLLGLETLLQIVFLHPGI